MPEVSRFFGIVIAMYYSDHVPPHFHARYGEHELRLDIDTGAILSGALPQRVQRLVVKWHALHRSELQDNWQRATRRMPLNRIDPLE